MNLLPYDTIISEHSTWSKHNYKTRLAEFKSDPITTGDIVFIGNSHIQHAGNWNKTLNIANGVNRGIGGDITNGVIARLEEVICAQPSKVVLLIGTNDIVWTKKSDVEIVRNINKIIDMLIEGLPSATIVVNTVMPINEVWDKKEVDHRQINERVRSINDHLQKRQNPNLVFFDLAALVKDSSGFLNDQLTVDGVHLNPEGKKLWMQELKGAIQ